MSMPWRREKSVQTLLKQETVTLRSSTDTLEIRRQEVRPALIREMNLLGCLNCDLGTL